MKIKQLAIIATLCLLSHSAWARDVEYTDKGEITIRVAPGEPTQISFPGAITGGVRKKSSALSLDHRDSDLVILANEAITESGEGIIVRLKDGRSFSLRIAKPTAESPRDAVIKVSDMRTGALDSAEEEDPAYKEKNFEKAPPTQIAGLMREMILVAEFGKKNIQGYRVSDSYKGQAVLNDGTINATIDRIFMGPNLWGYVLDTENLLSSSQKLNPAAFRIDGTRAISAKNWELTAIPLNIEQQLAGAHKTKVYIVAKARK